jgi:hypothetical protein
MRRKSLAETLTPEVRQFIEAGAPKPQGPEEPPPDPAPAPEVTEPRPVARPKAEEGVLEIEAPLITQSYRLPQPLVTALVRASMERKLARQKPWSQQHIVAEALTEWLKKHKSK